VICCPTTALIVLPLSESCSVIGAGLEEGVDEADDVVAVWLPQPARIRAQSAVLAVSA